MTGTGRRQTHAAALTTWYREAGPTLDDLANCSVVALATLIGSSATNRVILGSLNVFTREAELWQIMNPCPDVTSEQTLRSTIESFAAVGQNLSASGGDPDDGALAGYVERACWAAVGLMALSPNDEPMDGVPGHANGC
jgi:hypothetical protein